MLVALQKRHSLHHPKIECFLLKYANLEGQKLHCMGNLCNIHSVVIIFQTFIVEEVKCNNGNLFYYYDDFRKKLHNMKLHNMFSVLKILPNWNKIIPQNILVINTDNFTIS